MTQWLIEEACFIALELEEAMEASGDAGQTREEALLLERHAEMTALREKMRGLR